ncbi:MAG TPA: hypothetical protein VH396_06965 [Chitinophagaceae bacterium]|jgi:hypothetical protein
MQNQSSNTTQNKGQEANQSSSKAPTENPGNLNPNADMQEPGANMMDQKIQMNTLSEVLERLRLKKLDNEFRWTPEGFTAGKGKVYTPEHLTIIKTYRFEGESNPSDMEIIYIIEADDGLIGYSIDAYGMYSNHEDEEGYDNFIRKIPVKDRDEQLIFEI